MTNTEKALTKLTMETDWKLFAEQKLWLLSQPVEQAEGLINFIDALQDLLAAHVSTPDVIFNYKNQTEK